MSGSDGSGGGANDFVRHCHADNCLHCHLTGKGTAMHFVMHLLEHIFLMHLWCENKDKAWLNRSGHLLQEKFDTVKEAK